jgi:hypothetical protein
MARPATGTVVVRKGKHGTTCGIRFRAEGRRHYLTTDARSEAEAQTELANVLADVRRGLWRPPQTEIAQDPIEEPSFHVFASEWIEGRRPELRARSIRSRWPRSTGTEP